MSRTTTIVCPAGRHPELHWSGDGPQLCPTELQPYRGRLTDGVAQHLVTVHQLEAQDADRIAVRWVQRGGRA